MWGILAATMAKHARSGCDARSLLAGSVPVPERPSTSKGAGFISRNDEQGSADLVVRADVTARLMAA